MIQAYISIGLKSGMKVQYVRDVVTDTLGKNGLYYGYNGAGYQDLGMPDRKVVSSLNLMSGVTYYFKVSVDGGGYTEYSILPARVAPKLYQSPYIVSYASEALKGFDKLQIIKLLNAETNRDGAKWSLTTTGDIRCQSMSSLANSSVSVSAGTSGADLLASINADVQPAVAGDQLLDQTGAGKVYGDFLTLSHGVGQLVKEDVSYIAGTPQGIYIGGLKTFATPFNTHELKVFVNGVLQKSSELLEIGVESTGDTVSTIQPNGVTYDSSYNTNFVLFTSGNNSGEVRQITGGAAGVLNLDSDLPNNVEISDTYTIFTSYDYFVLENGVLFVTNLTTNDYVFIQQNDTQDGAFVFPESSGNSNILVRKNNNESLAGSGNIVTQIPINAITEIAIVEKTMNI